MRYVIIFPELYKIKSNKHNKNIHRGVMHRGGKIASFNIICNDAQEKNANKIQSITNIFLYKFIFNNITLANPNINIIIIHIETTSPP